MVDQFFFVFSNSPIQFVHQFIDCGIHAFFDGVGVDRTTIHINCGFCLMLQLFDGEDAVYVSYKIKMSLDFFYFGLDIPSQGFGDFDVMA